MKFSITNIDITPPFKTTMGGYASRQGLFEGINDRLTAAIIILDEDDKRVVIVAADLLGFNNRHVTELRQHLADIAATVSENILLNASHTHGGPESSASEIYFNEDRDTEPSIRYRKWLDCQLCEATKTAMSKFEVGSLWYGMGKSIIPMNRRLERNGEIVNAPNPDGEVDDRLQVLAIKDQNDNLRAVGIKLSCHPVATGTQSIITADFPGAFKSACRAELGNGVIPFFMQGAGGDMRPAPVADGDKWREMAHCELPQIGQQLLKETLKVLEQGLQKLDNLEFKGHFEYARVSCDHLYNSKADFEQLTKSSKAYEPQYGKQCLEKLKSGQTIPDFINIGVQTISLNKNFIIIGIQGEVLVGLGDYVEQVVTAKTGQQTLLLGYCNGRMCYIPDTKELERGGYEQRNYLFAGTTGPISAGVEKIIAATTGQ